MLHAFCTIFEPDPFKEVMGPTLAKNRPETAKTKTHITIFPRDRAKGAEPILD
jgi:hypothetical protein